MTSSAYAKIKNTIKEMDKIQPLAIYWQELHNLVSQAYRKGHLSDNEYDDLYNEILRRSK